MKAIYFTVTGTGYYYGQGFLEPGMRVVLVKDPDNKYDREAIRVELEGLGKIGYVANSPQTVLGESDSAGRLYDKIGDEASGEVMYLLPKGVLCRLAETEEESDERLDDEPDDGPDDEPKKGPKTGGHRPRRIGRGVRVKMKGRRRLRG